jgi:hypothetical protein
MGRYHFCHLMPAHLLHPTGMSGSLKGTPLLIATVTSSRKTRPRIM